MEKETMFAYTKIGETGFRYGSTVEMLERLDGDTIFYIIDPNGYDYCSKFKDRFNMKVVYIKAAGSIREQRANVRNGDNFTWKIRSADEDGQFTSGADCCALYQVCGIQNNCQDYPGCRGDDYAWIHSRMFSTFYYWQDINESIASK